MKLSYRFDLEGDLYQIPDANHRRNDAIMPGPFLLSYFVFLFYFFSYFSFLGP